MSMAKKKKEEEEKLPKKPGRGLTRPPLDRAIKAEETERKQWT